MPFTEILFAIVLLGLLIGSYSDFKKREVADWLNFSLIFIGISLRLLYSVIQSDYYILLEGILGLVVCVILAYIMFYAGQWGGGDAKMLMGLGALIGLPFSFEKIPFLANFLINVIIIGAFFGMFWSIALAIMHGRKFLKEFSKKNKEKAVAKIRKYVLVSSVLLIAFALIFRDLFFSIVLASVAVVMIVTLHAWIFIKSVEKSCMQKFVNPEELTEGDWIVNEIKIKGKYIAGPKDLGIQMKQIRKLIALKKHHKINKVLIKEGVPFVPSFFIAFVVTYFSGNLFYLII